MSMELHALFRPIQASGRVASYRYAEQLPAAPLRPYVSCYWTSEPAEPYRETAPLAARKGIDRVVPDGCSDFIFACDAGANRVNVRYCGIYDEPFAIEHDDRPVRSFGIRFFPGGAYPLLKASLAEFAGRAFSLDELLPGGAGTVAERLFAQPSFERQAEVADRFLMSRLEKNGRPDDSLVSNALYRIFVAKGCCSVSELAKAETVSARQLNRVFDRWIGLGPKKFSEIVRFQNVLTVVRNGRIANGSRLAADFGYSDQAHMIREFKRFYGESPLVAAAEYAGMTDHTKLSVPIK